MDGAEGVLRNAANLGLFGLVCLGCEGLVTFLTVRA